jgi:hypothetical protein
MLDSDRTRIECGALSLLFDITLQRLPEAWAFKPSRVEA